MVSGLDFSFTRAFGVFFSVSLKRMMEMQEPKNGNREVTIMLFILLYKPKEDIVFESMLVAYIWRTYQLMNNS